MNSQPAASPISRKLVNASAATTSRADSAAARRRDADAFERLIEPHRAGLQAHCYRMLGSAADAEDALQETLLRAWRGLPRFEGRSSLRSWLYRIATNACLTMIDRRPTRVMPIEHGGASDPHDPPERPLVEPVWLEPYPDEALEVEDASASPETRYERRESIELAFIAALQHLPSRQRAVLLLRDVLGLAPAEIAAALDTTPAAVYSLLKRARQAADERLPARSQQATLRTIGDRRLRDLVQRYIQAWDQGDVAAITEMLADDATFSMPPRPNWYRGRAAIGAFLAALPLSGRWRWRHVPTRANGQLSFGAYLLDAAGSGHAHAIQVLAVDTNARISDITVFHTPEAFARFGLPDAALPVSGKSRSTKKPQLPPGERAVISATAMNTGAANRSPMRPKVPSRGK
jgi:RNA polymerase sigma-70 factor (ECF subfamily)